MNNVSDMNDLFRFPRPEMSIKREGHSLVMTYRFPPGSREWEAFIEICLDLVERRISEALQAAREDLSNHLIKLGVP